MNRSTGLAIVGVMLSLHGTLVLADGPEAAYDSAGVPVQATLDPNEYQVNADGALEDPDHRMSDVARAYRNGYINRGKTDDALMKQKLAAQHEADMASVQRVPTPMPAEVAPLPASPPPAVSADVALPPPTYSALPSAMPLPYPTSVYGAPAYAPPPPAYAPAPPAYMPPPPVIVQQAYASPAPYVPVYPDAGYVGVQPLVVVTPNYGTAYYGGRGRGRHHWR